MADHRQFRSAMDALDRIAAAGVSPSSRAVEKPAPLTSEQRARAQGKALLNEIEAASSRTVTIPAVGGLR